MPTRPGAISPLSKKDEEKRFDVGQANDTWFADSMASYFELITTTRPAQLVQQQLPRSDQQEDAQQLATIYIKGDKPARTRLMARLKPSLITSGDRYLLKLDKLYGAADKPKDSPYAR